MFGVDHNRLTSLIKTKYKIVNGEKAIFKPEVPFNILVDSWLKIYSQYCDKIGDSAVLSVLQLTSKIAVLNSKISRVETTVRILRDWYSPNYANEISEDISGVFIDISSLESYHKSLDRVLSIIKTDIIERDALVKEFEELQNKSNKGKSITESYFTEVLMDISKYEGQRIIKSQITAGEYCSYVKRLNKYYDYLVTQKSKSANKK